MLYLTERVLRAWAGTMIPLRVFMGLQMLVYVLNFYIRSDPPSHSSILFQPYGWLWLLGLGGGGLWLMASAGAEGWMRIQNALCPWKVCPVLLEWVSRSRFTCYFFCGCLWSGNIFNSWMDGRISLMDSMSPVFLLFLVRTSVNDATQRRKRAMALQHASPMLPV